jgi:sugar lactone lactonase YvrE
MRPEVVADCACQTGEGPLWHPIEKRLYWCDIPRGRLLRYDPATGGHEMCLEGAPLGGFTVQADGALLLLLADGAIRTWHDGRFHTILDGVRELPMPEAASIAARCRRPTRPAGSTGWRPTGR